MTQESEDLALPTWPTCIARGCAGVRVEGRKACLAHVDGRTRKGILASLGPGAPLDLRGTPVSAELLGGILRAMRAKDGTAVLGKAQFERAQFTGNATFDRVRFTGDAWFTGAQFVRPASFFGARFLGDAWFDQVLFASKADFAQARFRRSSVFTRSQFITDVSFQDAWFIAGAWYGEAQFAGDTWFTWATFGGQYANFYTAQFLWTIAFVGARFAVEYTSFTEARFTRRGILGPICATGFLELDRTVFEGDIHIEALGPSLLCRDTQFQETATVRLRQAELVLDGSLFTNPSTISFAPDPFKSLMVTGKQESVLPNIELFKEVETERSQQDARPRLLSLRGVDTATLTLTDVDLGACLFAGAHHLDQLRIEGPRPFADSPPGWHRGRVGGHGLPVWRWTRRQTLAEEHQWRAGLPLARLPSGRPDPKQADWCPPSCQTPPWVAARTDQQVKPLSPDRLVLLYRSLRKAQEDKQQRAGRGRFLLR
jgi:hypothetical protein